MSLCHHASQRAQDQLECFQEQLFQNPTNSDFHIKDNYLLRMARSLVVDGSRVDDSVAVGAASLRFDSLGRSFMIESWQQCSA